MLWVEFIDAFGNPNLAFTTLFTSWPVRLNSLAVAILGSYTRAYFCYRLYFISKARWAVALVASTDVLALSFVTFALYLRSKNADNIGVLLYYTLHFSVVFAGDMLLTLLTAFFLTRTKKEVLPRSHGIINALIWLTFETAAPSAICSLINLVVSQLPTYFQLLAASNEVLPKLYAVSMMWSLNARQELRSLPWGNRSTLSYINSGNRPKLNTKGLQVETVHRDEFELRQYSRSSGVQTHKDTHADNNDNPKYPNHVY